jgi:hypothetical protein
MLSTKINSFLETELKYDIEFNSDSELKSLSNYIGNRRNMADNFFIRGTGIELTVPKFDRFVQEHFKEDAKEYLDYKQDIIKYDLEAQGDYITNGHHSACECGCLDLTKDERRYKVEYRAMGGIDFLQDTIENYCDELIFQSQHLRVHTECRTRGLKNKSNHVFVGCSEFLRDQRDYEYELTPLYDELVDRAIRTEFDSEDYPEADEDEIKELRKNFKGELQDLSVPVSDDLRKLLSTYGTIRDYCLYGSIYY